MLLTPWLHRLVSSSRSVRFRDRRRRAPGSNHSAIEQLEDRVLLAVGGLDPTFGTGGVVITDVAGFRDEATGIVVQDDGKIVIGGTAYQESFTGWYSEDSDFALARFDANGNLDTTFGTNGIVTTDFPGRKSGPPSSRFGEDKMHDIDILPDGKIVAVGQTKSNATEANAWALALYNPDGSLVTQVVHDVGPDFDTLWDVAVQNDGKIVATGSTRPEVGTSNEHIAVVRFNADLTLDTTFGTGGIVTTDIGNGSELAKAVVIQPDGKILVAGKAVFNPGTSNINRDSALVRYNTDGSLDNSFGTGGIVTIDVADMINNDGVARRDSIRDVALQSDGKIVVIGSAGLLPGEFQGPGPRAVAARFDTSGNLDPSFGTGGIVDLDLDEELFSVTIDGNDKILFAGWLSGAYVGNSGFVRLDTNGNIDGYFSVDIGQGEYDWLNAVALQPDGKIVAAGIAPYNSNSNSPGSLDTANFTVLRYEGDLPPVWMTIDGSTGTVIEGDSGTVDAVFTVNLNEASTEPVTVEYSTTDYFFSPNSNATAGVDYVFTTGVLTFAPGVTSQTFTVEVIGDTDLEDLEWYDVVLSNAVGAAIIGARASASIEDNDVPPPPSAGITVTPISGLVTTEKNAGSDSFTVVLDTQPSDNVTIGLSSSDTTEGTLSVSSLLFTPANWNTPQTVTVIGVDDTEKDGNIGYTIITAPAISSDSDYNTLDAADVSVTNQDNEKNKGRGKPKSIRSFIATSSSSSTDTGPSDSTTPQGVVLQPSNSVPLSEPALTEEEPDDELSSEDTPATLPEDQADLDSLFGDLGSLLDDLLVV